MERTAISQRPAQGEKADASYDAVKEFDGMRYTGMKVGGSHSWYYQRGEWNETKVAPDRWKFAYAVNKLRKWNAPEGSGAPVGTEYHWCILAHQVVRKLNANEYITSMTGSKYKLAHRRAGSEEWNASDREQLMRLIEILEENVDQLRRELGEADKETVAGPREVEPRVTKTNGRRKAEFGQRRPARNSPLRMVAEVPLESFMVP